MDRGVLRDEWMKGGRLDVLIGDLSLDNFDLGGEEWNRVAEEADAIPHNGALGLPVRETPGSEHYFPPRLSTLRVPESGDLEGARASLKTGQSKWIFEKLSFEDGRKGLRGHIVRPGYVIGDSQSLQTPDVQDELKNEALALLNNPLPHPPATLISPRYEWQIPDGFGNSVQNPQPGHAGAPYAFCLQGKDPLPSASLPDPRLWRELNMWKKLDHQNNLPLFGVVSDFGRYDAMICPWLDNGSVTKYMDPERCGDLLSMIDRLQLFCEVGEGTFFQHYPRNLTGLDVLINDQGKALLGDFGLSSIVAEFDGTSCMTSGVSGTVCWVDASLYKLLLLDDATAYNNERYILSFGSVTLEGATPPRVNLTQTFADLIRSHTVSLCPHRRPGGYRAA
ncbi:hypothetical protein EDD18DRAFT_1430247 [Armillaria luteobubalina]|uniref:Protein kinase domain-containing protein n=1 Tax=Armillaria luteobubalina TaxID=153913 RepID=A0AA39QE19_9AGAR|nr:hypothetical protein EDD18DRAFT_1430247 [Armillaria luteobubalina]